MKLIEEISLNAWPSLQTLVFDGWLLRFADGYTKRSNSVNPLYQSFEDVNKKIEKCELIYIQKGLKPIFKITPFIQPENLDNILDAKGYKSIDRTSVQSMDISDIMMKEPIPDILINSEFNAEWLADYCRLNDVKEHDRIVLMKIISDIIPEKYFVSLTHENRVIACGLGVLENGFMGLFDIVVDSACRNKGYGEQLIRNMIQIAKVKGARKVYLQVMLSNKPALRLYEKVGFKEEYQYWYRVDTGNYILGN